MILVKTDAGQQVLKDRSVRLSPRQRSAFILCDGKRSIDEVLAAGMGIGRDDIEQMIDLGLLGPLNGASAVATPALSAPVAAAVAQPVPVPVAVAVNPAEAARLTTESFAVAAAVPIAAAAAPVPIGAAAGQAGGARSRQQRYQDAYPIATRLTGSLGLRGFRLNLSVEGTSNYEELLALVPKIRSVVGPDKVADLDRALGV